MADVFAPGAAIHCVRTAALVIAAGEIIVNNISLLYLLSEERHEIEGLKNVCEFLPVMSCGAAEYVI